jgi:site-specific recombinase XerC
VEVGADRLRRWRQDRELKWRDLQSGTDGARWPSSARLKDQGGAATEHDLRELLRFRQHVDLSALVFASHRGGGHLRSSASERIETKAAEHAGVEGKVLPQWFRHSHATRALDRGAPVHLMQATVVDASEATTGHYLHARPTDSSTRYLAE